MMGLVVQMNINSSCNRAQSWGWVIQKYKNYVVTGLHDGVGSPNVTPLIKYFMPCLTPSLGPVTT